MTRSKSEKRITELEMRKDAIDSLRNWLVVEVGGNKSYVTAHSTGISSSGVLTFYVQTDDGIYARHMFASWERCDEIVAVDGSKSAVNN